MYLKNCLKFCKFFLFFIFIFNINLAKAESISQDENIINEGKSLFEGNCTVCHAIHEVVIGPALSGVHKRRPISWIKSFIRNSQKVIQSGDPYAVKLYEKYDRTQMTSFDFSDEQIMSILSYIKHCTDNPPVVQTQDTNVSSSNANNVVSDNNLIVNSYTMLLLFLFLIVLFVISCILFLITRFIVGFINKSENISDDDKELVNEKINFKKIFHSLFFKRISFFFLFTIILKSIIDSLFFIGVQQGYAPKQPIAFSHQLHAGQYQIECQYCHTGVMKSKNANIPSANICMNCHSVIKKDSQEIKKIYFAIENDVPIEWIRVHNLPKLAYFNHAQHVKVGGLECQNCHGPIEEMEVIYQHAPLTMGWCIECHRNQEVNANDNEYYDQLMQVHSSKKNSQLKVRDIGGLECGKCHY